MSETKERKLKIKECLRQLEEIHAEIISKKEDSNDWRNMAEMSLTRQISVLRLWQAESRLITNVKIAASSLVGVVIGAAGGMLMKVF